MQGYALEEKEEQLRLLQREVDMLEGRKAKSPFPLCGTSSVA